MASFDKRFSAAYLGLGRGGSSLSRPPSLPEAIPRHSNPVERYNLCPVLGLTYGLVLVGCLQNHRRPLRQTTSTGSYTEPLHLKRGAQLLHRGNLSLAKMYSEMGNTIITPTAKFYLTVTDPQEENTSSGGSMIIEGANVPPPPPLLSQFTLCIFPQKIHFHLQ